MISHRCGHQNARKRNECNYRYMSLSNVNAVYVYAATKRTVKHQAKAELYQHTDEKI